MAAVNVWSGSNISLLRNGRVVTEVGEANTYGAWGRYKRADVCRLSFVLNT